MLKLLCRQLDSEGSSSCGGISIGGLFAGSCDNPKCWARICTACRASGIPVKFIELIALELRKIPLDVIIDARIKAANNGINISIDDLSTHHLAGGDVHMVMQGLLKAKEKNIDLSFDHACALDLQDKGIKKKKD